MLNIYIYLYTVYVVSNQASQNKTVQRKTRELERAYVEAQRLKRSQLKLQLMTGNNPNNLQKLFCFRHSKIYMCFGLDLGATTEERMLGSVQRIVVEQNSDTVLSRARINFIKNFSALEKHGENMPGVVSNFLHSITSRLLEQHPHLSQLCPPRQGENSVDLQERLEVIFKPFIYIYIYIYICIYMKII